VDVTTVGGGQIAAGLDAPYDPDVYVFPEGGTTPSYSYDFDTSAPSGSMWDGGLAFSPDATVLFAVTGNLGDEVIFNVLSRSALSSSTSSTSTSSTTSTTLPCSHDPRCAFDVATNSPACAGESVPRSITGKLERAASLAAQLPGASGERAKHLRTRASQLLRAASRAARRAARGKRPKISSACSAAIAAAAGAERQGLQSP
jgi:hypothetical protein